MIVKFLNIHLENFMSFESADVELDNNGFVQIIGKNNNKTDSSKSNGSGKSAIWEALNWCLTGETLRGSKDVVRHDSEDGTIVSLEFEVDNCPYKLTRTKNHKKYKTNLFLIKNGEDISGKGIRDTEIILSNTLPELTPALINSIIILGQGLPMRFTNNTPSGRKEVLEKLSKSDFMIQDLKDRIAVRKQELDDRYKEITTSITKKETEYDFEKILLGKAVAELESLNDIDGYISRKTELEAVLVDLNNHIKTLQEKYNGHDASEEYDIVQEFKFNLQKQLNDQLSDISNIYQSSIFDKRNELLLLTSDINGLRNKISQLENVVDVCPTCGQKLPDVHKIDTTDLHNELNTKSANADIISDTIKNLEEEFSSKKKEKQAEFDDRLNGCNESLKWLKGEKEVLSSEAVKKQRIENELDSINSFLNNIKVQTEQAKKNIEESKETLNKISEEINRYKELKTDLELRLSIQSKFDTVIKRDFRGILLQNCITYINTKAKEYCKKVFDTDLISFALDGNNISISYCGKEYESMSGGEKQKIDLIIQFAIRSMLCTYLNFSCNLLVLDELTDNIDSDGCKKVIDFISDVAADVDSVYLISHHADLELPFDKILNVVKDERGISSVLLQA